MKHLKYFKSRKHMTKMAQTKRKVVAEKSQMSLTAYYITTGQSSSRRSPSPNHTHLMMKDESDNIDDPLLEMPSFQQSGTDSETSCTSLCCSTDDISQPMDSILLNKTKSVQSGKTRCFLPSWYKQFPWIHFARLN